jgi:ribosomal protein S18 acetylase RimI-like enzyme
VEVITRLSSGLLNNSLKKGKTVASMSTQTKHFKIETHYRPGCLGRMIALQAEVYNPIFGVGQAFEISRADDVSKFFTQYDLQRDGLLLAVLDGEIVGSVVIDGREQEARGPELRWFALDPKARGYGIGKRLLHMALGFCQSKGYRRVHLITSPRLETALHLYKQAGFQQTREFVDEATATPLLAFELHFARTLTAKQLPQKQYYQKVLN